MRLCVYALAARTNRRLAATGIAGEPIRRIRIGAIDILVGAMAKAPRPTVAALRRYDRLMTSLWRRYPALLPVRFGTTVRSQAELEALVAGMQPAIRRQLTTVRNRGQMTVRVLYTGARSATRPDMGRSPTASPGVQYLRKRAAEVRSAEVESLRAAVSRWIRAERVEGHAKIATVYHLIPLGAVDRYRAAMTSAAAEAGVRMILSGPYPPYAFSW